MMQQILQVFVYSQPKTPPKRKGVIVELASVNEESICILVSWGIAYASLSPGVSTTLVCLLIELTEEHSTS